MSGLIERLWAWLHTHEGRKIFRYTMVSVISTAVSFIVLALVYGVLRLWTEVPSTVFANSVATFPSYWLNRQWAWGKSGRSHFVKEVVPFWTMSAIGIAFSIVGASVARHIGIKYQLDHLSLTIVVLVANVLSFGVFWVLKLLLFNRIFHVSELEEVEEHLEMEEPRRAPRSADPSPTGISVPEVDELEGDPEVLALARGDDRLEAVALLAGDPQLVPLRLRAHALQVLVLDEPVDPPGVVRRDPCLDADALARRALGGLLDLGGVECLERYFAADQLLLEHLVEGAQAILGRGSQHELGLAELDRRVRPLEVEASGRLPIGLVHGVANLLHIDLGDDVKARHGCHSTVARPETPPTNLPGGSVSEWPKEADCKSAGAAYGGSNPSRPTRTTPVIAEPKPRESTSPVTNWTRSLDRPLSATSSVRRTRFREGLSGTKHGRTGSR